VPDSRKGADEEPAHRYQTIGDNGEGSRASSSTKNNHAPAQVKSPEQPGREGSAPQAFRRFIPVTPINDFFRNAGRIGPAPTLVVGRVAGNRGWRVLFTAAAITRCWRRFSLSRSRARGVVLIR